MHGTLTTIAILSRRRALWRGLAIAFLIVLATATHWPKLRIDGPIHRTDIWIHVAAFGVLGGLITLCAWFGPVTSRRNLAWAWVVGVVYAAIDETTQAIPILGRTAAWDDFFADVTGVTLGVLGSAACIRFLTSRAPGDPRANHPLPPRVATEPQTSPENAGVEAGRS